MKDNNYKCCSNCEQIGEETKINLPSDLQNVLKGLNQLIDENKIVENSFESSRALIGQPPFSEINPEGTYPDVMIYYFDCQKCKNVFELSVETYHGEGGSIKIVGNLS